MNKLTRLGVSLAASNLILTSLAGCNGIPLPQSDLLKSIRSGNLAKVRSLLDNGVDPNSLPNNSKPPLYLALEVKHYDIAEELLKHGANPNPWNDISYLKETPSIKSDPKAMALLDRYDRPSPGKLLQK